MAKRDVILYIVSSNDQYSVGMNRWMSLVE